MGTQENQANARRFLEEVVNRGNVAVIDELSSPNFVDHTAPPGVPAGNEGFKVFITMFRAAFPDLRYTIDDEIAEGDKVVERVTATGTMKGDFQGMPASGKTATWSEIHITRFENGKAAEHWGIADQLGMLAQLGFAEVPGQPAGVTG
jgi:steroid delta-isomerase-like uncharacterized protein